LFIVANMYLNFLDKGPRPLVLFSFCSRALSGLALVSAQTQVRTLKAARLA